MRTKRAATAGFEAGLCHLLLNPRQCLCRNESADPTQPLAKAADTATRTTAGHVRAADGRRW